MKDYYTGCSIRINAMTGSWGTVLYANHFGGLYVEFNYGCNAKGEPILSKANVSYSDLVPVDPNVYSQFIKCRAWSDEQNSISEAYLKTRQIAFGGFEV